MKIFGHRGAAGEVDENTLASVRVAIAAGADGVEFDVRKCRDDLVVMHDVTVDRTTSGSGPVSAYKLANLRQLRTAGGEPIPTYTEVLRTICGPRVVNIELKEDNIASAAVENVPSEIATDSETQFLFSSFSAHATAELARCLALTPYHLGILCDRDTMRALADAERYRAWSVHFPLELVDSGTIEAAHAINCSVYVYTVNELQDYDRCQACGADGIFTDYPTRMVAHRDKCDTEARSTRLG